MRVCHISMMDIHADVPVQSEYFKRGYQEGEWTWTSCYKSVNPYYVSSVISPNMYNSKLWETSGHWQNYKDDMFLLDIEKEQWALKPMNCPGHCLIFDSRDRSYRELPIRMAEFGIIHRNEASGALTGLTRVRRFVQDDTHVFCMPSQLEDEISALFDFMEHVYGLFGFEFRLELSTRPENYLGTIETWNAAEEVRVLAVPTEHVQLMTFHYDSNSNKHWRNTTQANGS
jgi:threonyl-tRNA synthetase